MSEEFAITEENDTIIADNLLKCLGTAYYIQYILASARIRIKNKVVMYTTPWQTVYSVIWLVLVTFSCSLYLRYFVKTFYHRDLLMCLVCVCGVSTQNLFYFLNNFINRFTQRDNNVKIYAMMQKVDRLLQLDKCSYYTDFQHRLNVIIVTMIIVGFLTGFAANAMTLLDEPGYAVFYGVGLITTYMDILLVDGMLYFLAIRTRILNSVIKDRINEYKGNQKKKTKVRTLKRLLLSLAVPTVQTSSLNIPHVKWLECLQDILKSYKIITELFSFSILTISITLLIWTYLIIATIVRGLRSGLFPLVAAITIAMWAGFYYLQLTVAAVINDWFIMEVKKTKLLCIRLISYNYDGPCQKTASDMIRVIHYNAPIFDVYGLFVLDRRLPIEIIGVIASNVLVLVQFIV